MPVPSQWALVSSLLLSGCSSPDGPFLVIGRNASGDYDLLTKEIPDLENATRLSGTLGPMYDGGRILVANGEIVYRKGSVPNIAFDNVDGAFVAADTEGLIVVSFYHHLGALKNDLESWDYDLDASFPLDAIAWMPSLAGETFSFENAFYMASVHSFGLLPDTSDGIPLAANEGVVRHEFGHAWLHELCPQAGDAPNGGGLHEGFGDIVGGITLDDPRMIEPSLHLPDRWMDDPERAWAQAGEEVHDQGAVFAAWAWDLRVASDDPQWSLQLVVDAIQDWCEDGDVPSDARDVTTYVIRELDNDPELQQEMCEATALRFGTFATEIPECAN